MIATEVAAATPVATALVEVATDPVAAAPAEPAPVEVSEPLLEEPSVPVEYPEPETTTEPALTLDGPTES